LTVEIKKEDPGMAGVLLKGEIKLHKRLSRFDSALNGVTGLVYYALDAPSGALDSLISFFAEAFGLLLEVIGGVFQVISCVFDTLAKLFARFGAGLGSVEKSDCGPCCHAYAEGQPVVFCAHFLSYLVIRLYFAFGWIRGECDWLAFICLE
jgi:hypothetical protein